MKARGPLALAFVVAGLILPVLPRWIMPMLRPGVRYLDDAASLVADRRSLFLFSAVSVVPFIALAIFAWFHLRGGDAMILRKRFVAVLVTFAALFVLGWWCHMPQTVAGVNFAVVFFPVYAALVAPLAYGLGRLVMARSA